MKKNSGKYNFLKIERVIIRNFSLYPKNNSVVDEVINNGVYCLAGANGLGKTTFLNILNYGLTGIVLKPNDKVYSPREIEKFNKDYTDSYFDGRINAKDKNEAEIELHLLVGSVRFRIIRDFNNREGLRSFEAYMIENGKKISIINTQKHSPKELNKEYQKEITKQIGIGKFEFFIFFQLYVFTFDENRRILFWDEDTLTNVLSIAFNYDLSDTDNIINLKKDMEKLESDARNVRWQATQVKSKIQKLLQTKQEKEKNNWDELKKHYDNLFQETEEKEKTYKNVEIEYDTLLRRQNIINSGILQLKTTYKKLFSQYSEPRSKLLNNQYTIYSKKERKCFLCGSSGHYVIQNIEKNLHQDKCPVCNTTINDKNDSNQNILLKQLAQIDNEINSKTEELENLIFESEAKKVKLEKAEFGYYSANEKLDEFEKENSNLDFNKTGNQPIDNLIEDYKRQFERFDKESQDCYKKRNKLRPEYDNLLARVNSAYKEAEEHFVPLFKNFSKSFLGLELNIFFKQKGKNILLNFELQGTARPDSSQVSESQRFFLDIALRMALSVYLSKNDNEATILIDTPEGSLDIAYESRVGKMFADFVVDFKQNIIMTANINASQLLISLAIKCREKKMKFRRMLDWTDLTEIQKEGEYLFEKVFKNIESSLKGKNYE